MYIINQEYTIHRYPPDALEEIESAARISYRSEDRAGQNTQEFVRRLMRDGAYSQLEHADPLKVDFTTSIGVARELLRHRLVVATQESTRYVKYGINFPVIDPGLTGEAREVWIEEIKRIEECYQKLLPLSAQTARVILPLCLATKLRVTANLREWRRIFLLRTAPAAHPEMRRLMEPLLSHIRCLIPVVFETLGE